MHALVDTMMFLLSEAPACKHESVLDLRIGNPNSDVSYVYLDGEALLECGSYPDIFDDGHGNVAVKVCVDCMQVVNFTREQLEEAIVEMRRERDEIRAERAEEDAARQEEWELWASWRKMRGMGLAKLLKEQRATITKEVDEDNLILKRENGETVRATFMKDGVNGVWSLDNGE